MVTDFEELIALCDEELRHREYCPDYYVRLTRQWDALRAWMESKGLPEFNEDVGNAYCDDVFGTHLMPKRPPVLFREKLRTIRMLISYQKNGDFEFRCPSVEYIFEGDIGLEVLRYLDYCKTELLLAEKTLEHKMRYLYQFYRYMKVNGLCYEDLSIKTIEAFFSFMNYTLPSRHNAAHNIKLFLAYVYDNGKSCKDCSVYILPDNYKKDCKLPTTYEEDEIHKLLLSVERASAIGRRDYLKYSRPKAEVPEVIVSMENANKGKPLSSPRCIP